MTTDKSRTSIKLIKDLKSIPSLMFYIFAAVAVFAGLYVGGFTAAGIFSAIFLVLLVACASADINAGIVPDLIVIFIAVLGLIKYFVTEPVSVSTAIPHLIGAVCISVPMLLLALIIKGAFGGGDIKLMAAAGLYLGWRITLAGVAVGLFAAGLYGIYLLICKKAGLKSKLRLVPFLAYGLGIASLFGDTLIRLLFGWQI
jgi:leader peptidase (prepilin peptidase)/N-methyltransferase